MIEATRHALKNGKSRYTLLVDGAEVNGSTSVRDYNAAVVCDFGRGPVLCSLSATQERAAKYAARYNRLPAGSTGHGNYFVVAIEAA